MVSPFESPGRTCDRHGTIRPSTGRCDRRLASCARWPDRGLVGVPAIRRRTVFARTGGLPTDLATKWKRPGSGREYASRANRACREPGCEVMAPRRPVSGVLPGPGFLPPPGWSVCRTSPEGDGIDVRPGRRRLTPCNSTGRRPQCPASYHRRCVAQYSYRPESGLGLSAGGSSRSRQTEPASGGVTGRTRTWPMKQLNDPACDLHPAAMPHRET